MKKYFIPLVLITIGIAFFINTRFQSIANTKPQENLDQLIKKFGVPIEADKPEFRENIDETKTFSGIITPFVEVEVSAKVGDWIIESNLELGKQVKANEVLIKISDNMINTQIKLAQAAVQQTKAVFDKVNTGARPQEIAQAEAQARAAQAQLNNAAKEFTRMKSLKKNNAIPKQQADKIMAAYEGAKAVSETAKEQVSLLKEGARIEDKKAAEASWKQALAQLELAKLNLSYTKITSPINGRISKIIKEEGEQTGIGKPVFTVVDISRVYLVADVPEKFVNSMKKGMKVKCATPNINNKIFNGTVDEISPMASNISRTYSVKVLIDNKDHTLKPGMFAHGNFIMNSIKNACLIPRSSIYRTNKSSYVFIVKNEIVEQIKITTKDVGNDLVAIFPELNKDDQVVVRGIKNIKNKSKIRLIEKTL